MRKNRKNSGVAFIITLLVLSLLVSIVAIVAADQQVAGQARINKSDELEARQMAMSGINLAVSLLSSQSKTATLQTDDWNQIGGSPGQPGSIKYDVGNNSFRIEIVDACSRVDLNTATSAQLLNLPLTQAQVDSLLDWREASTTARADGAKDDFYMGLPNPYLTKLGPLYSLDELTLVDNFTPATLYDTPSQLGVTTQITSGTDSNQDFSLSSLCTVDATSPNAASTGGAKVNINTSALTLASLIQKGIPIQLADAIYNRRPITSLGQLLTLPGVTSTNAALLLNNLTTTTGTTSVGKINLNTASEAALTSITGITPDIAQAIVTQQQNGFQSLASVLTVSGITTQAASQWIDDFSTASNTFLVRCIGTAGSANVSIEATIQLGGTNPQVIKLYTPPFPDMATRWQWFDATTDTDAVNSVIVTTTTSSSSSSSTAGSSTGGGQ